MQQGLYVCDFMETSEAIWLEYHKLTNRQDITDHATHALLAIYLFLLSPSYVAGLTIDLYCEERILDHETWLLTSFKSRSRSYFVPVLNMWESAMLRSFITFDYVQHDTITIKASRRNICEALKPFVESVAHDLGLKPTMPYFKFLHTLRLSGIQAAGFDWYGISKYTYPNRQGLTCIDATQKLLAIEKKKYYWNSGLSLK